MKYLFLLYLYLVTFLFSQSSLEVGMPAPEWEFPDADGNMFTMDNWAGKIMGVSYVDPDESEMNEEFSDRVKKAIDVDSLIARDSFKGIGIADCASSWKPDFLIRAIGGRKAKKYETTVLFDFDAILRKSWDLNEDSYNIVILDKSRIVRGLYKEKMSESEMDEALQLIISLQ